jgi:hypothetical protein
MAGCGRDDVKRAEFARIVRLECGKLQQDKAQLTVELRELGLGVDLQAQLL